MLLYNGGRQENRREMTLASTVESSTTSNSVREESTISNPYSDDSRQKDDVYYDPSDNSGPLIYSINFAITISNLLPNYYSTSSVIVEPSDPQRIKLLIETFSNIDHLTGNLFWIPVVINICLRCILLKIAMVTHLSLTLIFSSPMRV